MSEAIEVRHFESPVPVSYEPQVPQIFGVSRSWFRSTHPPISAIWNDLLEKGHKLGCHARLLGSRGLAIQRPQVLPRCLTTDTDWDVVATPAWVEQHFKLSDSSMGWEACLTTYNNHTTIALGLQAPPVYGQGTSGIFPKLDIILVVRAASSAHQMLTTECIAEDIHFTLPVFHAKQPKQYPAPLQVLNVAMLEVIKTSHIHWSSDKDKWMRHIQDLHALRRELELNGDDLFFYKTTPPDTGFCRSRELEQFLQLRRAETLTAFGEPARKINLNQSANDFLVNNTLYGGEREEDHDVLHTMTALSADRVPLYRKILVHPDKALCSEKKFRALTYLERVQTVQEEGLTLAIERVLLPGHETDPNIAFQIGIQRVCTSIARGWFRQFAVDHWPVVSILPRNNLLAIRDQIRARFTPASVEERLLKVWNKEGVTTILQSYRDGNVITRPSVWDETRTRSIIQMNKSKEQDHIGSWSCTGFDACVYEPDRFEYSELTLKDCDLTVRLDTGDESGSTDCHSYSRYFGRVTVYRTSSRTVVRQVLMATVTTKGGYESNQDTEDEWSGIGETTGSSTFKDREEEVSCAHAVLLATTLFQPEFTGNYGNAAIESHLDAQEETVGLLKSCGVYDLGDMRRVHTWFRVYSYKGTSASGYISE